MYGHLVAKFTGLSLLQTMVVISESSFGNCSLSTFSYLLPISSALFSCMTTFVVETSCCLIKFVTSFAQKSVEHFTLFHIHIASQSHGFMIYY